MWKKRIVSPRLEILLLKILIKFNVVFPLRYNVRIILNVVAK